MQLSLESSVPISRRHHAFACAAVYISSVHSENHIQLVRIHACTNTQPPRFCVRPFLRTSQLTFGRAIDQFTRMLRTVVRIFLVQKARTCALCHATVVSLFFHTFPPLILASSSSSSFGGMLCSFSCFGCHVGWWLPTSWCISVRSTVH